MTDVLNVETSSGVAVWTMAAPPVNAIETTMLDALDRAADDAIADANVSVVVLGSRLRVFCAGADAGWMARTLEDVGPIGLLERFNVMMDQFRALCSRLHHSRLLTIAAVDGHALAGGLELAAACDLRFVADQPRLQLGVPEMKLFGAMPSGGGGVPFLTRLLGPSAALLFILDGEPVSPGVGRGLGLVDRLCADDTATATALAFATRTAERAGPVGVAALKTSVMRGSSQDMSAALTLDRSLHWDAMRRGNFLSGVEQFAKTFG
jgi:enoyl-CoA hydratase